MHKLQIIPIVPPKKAIPDWKLFLLLLQGAWRRLTPSTRRLITACGAFIVGIPTILSFVSGFTSGLSNTKTEHVLYYEMRKTPEMPPKVAPKVAPKEHVTVCKTSPHVTVDTRAPSAAPMAPKTPTDAKAYIAMYSALAKKEYVRTGILPSITLAQGLVESRAGKSTLAVGNNNHFGLKCFSKNCRKGHCSNHTDDTHKDFFLKFSTPEQGFKAHSDLLLKPRYSKLRKYGRSYQRWAQGLQSAGYATDKAYAKTLISVIERYELFKFDK